MGDREARSWWQDGVLGRFDVGKARTVNFAALGPEDDGLGLDGVLLVGGVDREPRSLLEGARDAGVRVVVEIEAKDADAALVDEAERWIDAGAAGVVLGVGVHRPTARATVTSLHGEPVPEGRRPKTTNERVRDLMDALDGVFVGWRAGDEVGPPPPGPHVVIETTLARRPWRAATLGDAVERTIAELPAGHWPGYAMGAPRRGPFAVGVALDDALACSAALHLTLRGTPCIELGAETELPDNDGRRQWYRTLLDLRRAEPALHRGTFRRIRQEKSVLGYLREYEAERLVVLLNLGRRTRPAQLPTGFGWTVVLSNGAPAGHRFAGGEISLPGCGILIARAGTPQSRTLGGSGQRRATGP